MRRLEQGMLFLPLHSGALNPMRFNNAGDSNSDEEVKKSGLCMTTEQLCRNTDPVFDSKSYTLYIEGQDIS